MKKVFYLIGILTFAILMAFTTALSIDFIKIFSKLQDIENRLKRIEVETLERKARRLEVWATAYTSSKEECDDTPYITASGSKVFWGVIAADKRFKFGTKVYIPYFKKVFVVLDRGSAIKGNRIDIWMQDKKSAIKFGRKKIEIYVLGGGE